MLFTSALLILTAVHCYSIGVLDATSTMGVTTIQLCKLLHLLGLSHEAVVATTNLIISIVFPFFFKAAQLSVVTTAQGASLDAAFEQLSSPSNRGGTVFDMLQLLLYSGIVFAATLHARESILNILLLRILGHTPSALQEWCGVASVVFAIISC